MEMWGEPRLIFSYSHEYARLYYDKCNITNMRGEEAARRKLETLVLGKDFQCQSCRINVIDCLCPYPLLQPPTCENRGLNVTRMSSGVKYDTYIAYQKQAEKTCSELMSLTKDNVQYEFAVPLRFCAEGMFAKGTACRCAKVTFEKAVMLCKAAVHGDVDSFNSIYRPNSAAKTLGAHKEWRGVKDFDQVLWNNTVYAVAYEVVYQKFAQAQAHKDSLLSTGELIIAGAAYDDTDWDIGPIDTSLPTRQRDKSVPAANILGWALMETRASLRSGIEIKHGDHPDPFEWLPGDIIQPEQEGLMAVESKVNCNMKGDDPRLRPHNLDTKWFTPSTKSDATHDPGSGNVVDKDAPIYGSWVHYSSVAS